MNSGFTIYRIFNEKNDIIKTIIKNPLWYPYISCCELASINYANFDPYKNWYTIIYIIKNGSYHIIGYVEYDNEYVDIISLNYINNSKCPFINNDEKLINNSFFDIPWIKMPIQKQNVKMQDVHAYVDDMLSFEKTNTNGSFNMWMFITVQIACTFEKVAFRKWELYEKTRFIKQFDDINEKWIIGLLIHNNYSKQMLSDMSVTPTLHDRKRFYKSFPSLSKPPTVWFNIPLIEVPSIENLKVYKGGFVHISLLDVKYWLWDKVCDIAGKTKTNMIRSQRNKKPLLLLTQFDDIIKYINLTILKKKKENRIEITVDIEDLAEMLPKCTRQYITNNRYPTYDERPQLVSTLQEGGVSFETIEKFLIAKNAKYPNDQSILKRWNYKKYFDKNLKPKYCNTLLGGGECPYNGSKHKCLDEFIEKWPQHKKSANVKYLSGPHKWIDWILYWEKKKLEKNE